MVLILHGCCYCGVAHRLHHRKQILRSPVHFSSEAVTSAVQNQVIRQAGIFPSVLESLGHRGEMATPCPFRWKDPAFLLIGIPNQERLENARADRNVPSSLWGFAVVDELTAVRPIQVLPAHREYFLLISHSGIAHNQ